MKDTAVSRYERCSCYFSTGLHPWLQRCRSYGAVVKIANMHCSINFWHYCFFFEISKRTKVSMAMYILEQSDLRVYSYLSWLSNLSYSLCSLRLCARILFCFFLLIICVNLRNLWTKVLFHILS